MNNPKKRKDNMTDQNTKRPRKECSYGESCYRRNPAHFREFSHPHLESILDLSDGTEYNIPAKYNLQRHTIQEQLEIIVEKKLYVPRRSAVVCTSNVMSCTITDIKQTDTMTKDECPKYVDTGEPSQNKHNVSKNQEQTEKAESKGIAGNRRSNSSYGKEEERSIEGEKLDLPYQMTIPKKPKDSDYKPIVPPSRRAEDFLKVVRPRGKMAAKHAASAPYHIFYTTISDAKETHSQPYSITFLEILDSSLGELKCSLQINFMVEIAWLLAQYYFAGYSQKRLTILYGDDSPDMKTISQKKPHVDAYLVPIPTPFGSHHTKMMVLCYEDGSLRVVVSTANLYIDDWENRTQGLWMSPSCPELPADAMPHDGESPTGFKRSLLKYLTNYHLPMLSYYVDRVKRCDFSHINVFLIASVPGSHPDMEFGLNRVGAVLRQHCEAPGALARDWPLIAQASSLGSFGTDPKQWLTGDFLHNFTKVKNQQLTLSAPSELKIIYPSLENVRQSHDDLLGGGCLPYSGSVHAKQMWLNDFLFQWRATSTHRNKAMPHIKSYTRISKDNRSAAFFLLTSANISKAAWGQLNKAKTTLRILSYEAGVLFVPRFVIKEDFFPLDGEGEKRLILPYDVPPTKYEAGMSTWVQDYLR